jgi:RimJ/RimL family protein N-acetyltransferase
MVYGHDKAVAEWVRRQLDVPSFGTCRAIGVALGNELIGGVVYHNYRKPGIELGAAATNKRWMSRRTLRNFLSYPFEELDCKRVTAVVDVGNQPSVAFLEKLGFTREGTLREATPSGDAYIYGMLKQDCRWL